MERRKFMRVAGGIAAVTIGGTGVTAGHAPGEAEDDDAGNGCHSRRPEGSDSGDAAQGTEGETDEGDAREGRNPEC